MAAFQNNAVVNVAVSDLTSAELEAIHSRLHLRIYEPVVAPFELMFTIDGDIMMAWGGEYAT